jgi:catechol 2,3-dioxygenase-like lactoylglutathione lyase family enzyme
MNKPFVPDTGAALVRSQVADLERAIEFYTQPLGFRMVQRAGPVGIVARGALHLLLSGPGSSGSRPTADGAPQAPGGWNRIVLYVDDLDASIATLRKARAHFRNTTESGPGAAAEFP